MKRVMVGWFPSYELYQGLIPLQVRDKCEDNRWVLEEMLQGCLKYCVLFVCTGFCTGVITGQALEYLQGFEAVFTWWLF